MEIPYYDVVIVGGGISGLSTARFIKDKDPNMSVLVLEKTNRPGGAMWTHSEEGYLAEGGPHGFLDNCKESAELIDLAGLRSEMVTAPLGDFVRYVCLNRQLQCIPQNPKKIIMADLISLSEKFRVLGELFKKPLVGEPTVAQWVEHRLGKAMLPFADAVYTGTYAGDIERLKIDAVMPGVRALEKEHGSFIKGLLKKRKEKKKKGGDTSRGLPAMTSFSTGMSRLPQALAGGLVINKEIMYQTKVSAVVPGNDIWEVQTCQHRFRCRHMVLAVPINKGLELLNSASYIEKPPISNVPECKIVTVALGFPTAHADVPFGFGYLAPEREKRFALGALFSSHMFSDRAPHHHLLMEALVGGRRHPERLELDDDELVNRVYEDIRELIPLRVRPKYSRVIRPKAEIPQLEEGYPALLEWRNKLHAQHSNLHVIGFGWDGIGINDMTKHAAATVHRILTDNQSVQGPEVKGVYF